MGNFRNKSTSQVNVSSCTLMVYFYLSYHARPMFYFKLYHCLCLSWCDSCGILGRFFVCLFVLFDLIVFCLFEKKITSYKKKGINRGVKDGRKINIKSQSHKTLLNEHLHGCIHLQFQKRKSL